MEEVSTEIDLMEEIIRHPQILEHLDDATIHGLAQRIETRWRFLQVIANPLLEKLSLPDGTRLVLETDGEKHQNENHLHVEFDDGSPFMIAEVEELSRLSAIDLVSDEKKGELFGILAKAIQTAVQNGNIIAPEIGRKKKTDTASREEKERLLNQIAKMLLAEIQS